MRFEYFEIRPCVDDGISTRSFLGEPEVALAEAQAYQERHGGELFWTLYELDEEGLGHAIDDFSSFDAARETMEANWRSNNETGS